MSDNDFTQDTAPSDVPTDTPAPKATVTAEKEILQSTENDYRESIKRLSFLMAHTALELKKIGKDMPNISANSSDELKEYLTNVSAANLNYFDDGLFENIMDREGGDWKQVLEHNGKRLAMGRPDVPTTPGSYSGDNAISDAAKALGQGTRLSYPLYRSGIWITFRPPSDARLSETERLLSQAKVHLGRDTYGNIFSNNMVYTVRILLDLMLDHIYHTTVRVANNTELLGLISITDLGNMAASFACTIYPRTYPYAHSCVTDPSKCNHVEFKDAHIKHMIWHDRSRLTDEQLQFMSNRTARHTVAEVKDYQSKHVHGMDVPLKLSDSFIVTFAEPSLLDFINAGEQWIDSIVDSADRVISKDENISRRREYIREQTMLRQLGEWQHWIKRITMIEMDSEGDEFEKVIEDRKTINRTVQEVISADVDLRKKVKEKAIEVASESAVTVIGHLRSPCPNCKAMPEGHDRYKSLVPVNPVTVFFVLLGQKLSFIAANE